MNGDDFPGVDMDKLIEPGFNVLLHRCADRSWVVSYNHCNPRKRIDTITARGADLAACLCDLEQQVQSITT